MAVRMNEVECAFVRASVASAAAAEVGGAMAAGSGAAGAGGASVVAPAAMIVWTEVVPCDGRRPQFGGGAVHCSPACAI
eukprot:scaffold42054_cov18-Tisochrysis_lutea.AAC.4